jgi:hypothetical protein
MTPRGEVPEKGPSSNRRVSRETRHCRSNYRKKFLFHVKQPRRRRVVLVRGTLPMGVMLLIGIMWPMRFINGVTIPIRKPTTVASL